MDRAQRAPTAELLSALGLMFVPVAADVNCLYRAVAVGLLDTEDKHLDVRNAVLFYVERNMESFREFYATRDQNVGGADNKRRGSIIADLSDMRTPVAWGSGLQLAAASRAFWRDIVRLAPHYSTIYKAAAAVENPLYVIFNGTGHYSGTKRVA